MMPSKKRHAMMVQKLSDLHVSASRAFQKPLVRDACLALLFAIAYTQRPLFHSDQNTYFINALTDAGYGFLENDWLAGTTDPCPVFSYIINVTYRALDLRFVYFYYMVLMGIYFISLLRIMATCFNISRVSRNYIALATALIFLHSEILSHITEQVFDFRFDRVFLHGIPSQKVLGPELKPSSSGVFLLTSIALFFGSRPFLAIVAIGVAASIHPTYLLSGALLTAAYIVISYVAGKSIFHAIKLGVLALIVVAPITWYSVTTFTPTDPETYDRAMRIIAYERVPEIAWVKHWFDWRVVFKTAWFGLAVYVMRGTTLFLLFAIVSGIAILLSAVQVATQSTFLALLFPWRVTAFLMPIGTAVLVEHALRWGSQRYEAALEKHETRLVGAVAGVLFVAVVGGVGRQVREHKKFWDKEFIPVIRYVQENKTPDDTYLIPTRWWRFRMLTGAPVFVDWKVFRWKDTETIEWNTRLKLAQRFYLEDTTGEEKIKILEMVAEKYGVTHVLVKRRDRWMNAARLENVHDKGDYALYKRQ